MVANSGPVVLSTASVESAASSQIQEGMGLAEYGGSAAAIILAVAVLIRALAEMLRVLVPVMLRSGSGDKSN